LGEKCTNGVLHVSPFCFLASRQSAKNPRRLRRQLQPLLDRSKWQKTSARRSRRLERTSAKPQRKLGGRWAQRPKRQEKKSAKPGKKWGSVSRRLVKKSSNEIPSPVHLDHDGTAGALAPSGSCWKKSAL